MKKMFASMIGLIAAATLSGCAVYPSPDQYSSVVRGSSITPDMSYHQPRAQQAPDMIYRGANGKIYTPQQLQQSSQYIAPAPQYVQPQPQPQYQYVQPQYVQPQQQYQYVQPQYGQQQYQYVQPVYGQQQYYQDGRQVRQGSSGGAALGGIVGGLAMSGVGKGNGNLAAIAAGSATGAVVGTGCRSVNGGQVIGGLLGGLLGSTIGGGNGRKAAVAVGSGMGALVGNDAAGGCLGY